MRIFRFNEIDSTNNFLKERKDLVQGDLAIAKIQNAGRGRRGNKWMTSEGAALFSFVLKHEDTISDDEYMKLPLLLGYSLLQSLKKIENLNYKFKWTNDIYLEDKKISGILVERINDNYIIGIGININNGILENTKKFAMSLKEKTGKNYDLEDIILTVVKDFFTNFKNGNWENILKEINIKNYLFGKKIEISIGDKIEKGIAGDILEDGRLEVFIGNEIKKYNIGEIHIPKISK